MRRFAGVAELVDARGLGPRGHKPWGFESLRPHRRSTSRRRSMLAARMTSPLSRLRGTKESSSATLVRWETEMFRGSDCVHRTPRRSQYSQNSALMSVERFEKNQRGYAYSATRPLGSRVENRFTVRHPSECRSPRRNSCGKRSTISRCHGSSSILRLCLRPGSCCGKASGHRLLQPTTRTHRLTGCGFSLTCRGSSVSIIDAAQSSMMSGYAASHVTTAGRCASTSTRSRRQDASRGDSCTTSSREAATTYEHRFAHEAAERRGIQDSNLGPPVLETGASTS